MSGRSSGWNDKNDNSNELHHENCNVGTAARTRPFSFDEIMFRRKHKKQTGDVKDTIGGLSSLSKDIVDDDDRFKSKHHSQNRGSPLGAHRFSSEESIRLSVRKNKRTCFKEEKVYSLNGKSNYGSDSKLTVKPKDKSVGCQSKNFSFVKKGHCRNKNYEMSTDDHDSESGEKFLRGFAGKDRYVNKSWQKSESERKRKHRSVDEGKTSDRSYVKNLDPRKRQNFEFSERERRGESPTTVNEESRRNRKRSRSWELVMGRDRPASLSPRAHKSASHHGWDYESLSPQSLKRRLGRQNLDLYISKIPGNGSSRYYRRHGLSSSGLGGYSPRKRKNEVPVKTLSQIKCSPEKKSAGWDLPPGADCNLPVLANSFAESSSQNEPSSVKGLNSVGHVNINAAIPPRSSCNISSTVKGVSIDSIQLTQATRPLRIIYVENVPTSASEKSLMECLNKFLLSSGNSQVLGTQPCISSIIHKEKGHAFMEFLTPEGASAALSYDGRSFLGSILKTRRPKDFFEATTGVSEKSATTVGVISDTVIDSPHKIFIGGISEVFSSEMIMEIVCAFGPLKAFIFDMKEGDDGPRAFLEYVDPAVTLKACAGLNCLKLGGQVLTAVQTLPNASQAEITGNPPFFGTPEHAKPLLEKPTETLKLKNVFDPETLSSLSEAALEEILEDIRIECARFGSIKAVNVVRHNVDCSEGCQEREVAVNVEEGRERREESHEPCRCAAISGECHDMVVDEVQLGAAESELELGCVVVEYRRSESCCMAAHCLHGRTFGDRILAVSYVAPHHYKVGSRHNFIGTGAHD